jgi:phosphate transport system permease protein
MATDTRSDVIESFGQVDKTVGSLFRYLLQAATAFGIAILAVLLLFVFNDAVQPLTADPGWHLTFFAVLVVPTMTAGSYLYVRNRAAFSFGMTTLGLLVVCLMFAGGAALIFVDLLPPVLVFGYAVAIGTALGVVVLLESYSHRFSFWTRFGGSMLVGYFAFTGFPGIAANALGVDQILADVPTLIRVNLAVLSPPDWLFVLGSIGVLLAGVVGLRFASLRDRRTGLVAAGGSLLIVAVLTLLAPLVSVTRVPAAVLATMVVLPMATYAGGVVLERPEERVGLVFFVVAVAGALLGEVAVTQFGFAGPQSWVDWQFLTDAHSRTAENAGLYVAIGGSILLMIVVALFSFPLGVGAAVYLEEYAPNNRLTRFIDVNISNLAGVPSVVYGLLGLGVFFTYLNQPTGTVMIGGVTLALLILPIVIVSSREAIRSVPNDARQASYGMGATRYQTVRRVVLPEAFPGILTGTILALGRAIGETAPLIMIGAPSVVFNLPGEISAKVSAMPLQVYAWSSLFAGPEFYQKAVPAGVVVLVSVLLAMNSIAIVLRNRYQTDG